MKRCILLALLVPLCVFAGEERIPYACDNGSQGGSTTAVDVFCDVAVSAQGREGVQAFAQKRPPAWRRRG